MNDEELKILDDEYDSKYYVLGNTVPVRVIFTKRDGLKAGAIAPDIHLGELTWRHELLSRLEQSYEVEAIDGEEFYRLCRAFQKPAVPPRRND
ncbi:hypothetical protein [Sinorhizobium meliloti]|uniref:hypothetical protein n=1 Tax=Rhizobium meliloti TaxID=382 RepID=UPI00036BEBBF|nr:hypothetical protein [Sinorhizobium meliloti]